MRKRVTGTVEIHRTLKSNFIILIGAYLCLGLSTSFAEEYDRNSAPATRPDLGRSAGLVLKENEALLAEQCKHNFRKLTEEKQKLCKAGGSGRANTMPSTTGTPDEIARNAGIGMKEDPNEEVREAIFDNASTPPPPNRDFVKGAAGSNTEELSDPGGQKDLVGMAVNDATIAAEKAEFLSKVNMGGGTLAEQALRNDNTPALQQHYDQLKGLATQSPGGTTSASVAPWMMKPDPLVPGISQGQFYQNYPDILQSNLKFREGLKGAAKNLYYKAYSNAAVAAELTGNAQQLDRVRTRLGNTGLDVAGMEAAYRKNKSPSVAKDIVDGGEGGFEVSDLSVGGTLGNANSDLDFNEISPTNRSPGSVAAGTFGQGGSADELDGVSNKIASLGNGEAGGKDARYVGLGAHSDPNSVEEFAEMFDEEENGESKTGKLTKEELLAKLQKELQTIKKDNLEKFGGPGGLLAALQKSSLAGESDDELLEAAAGVMSQLDYPESLIAAVRAQGDSESDVASLMDMDPKSPFLANPMHANADPHLEKFSTGIGGKEDELFGRVRSVHRAYFEKGNVRSAKDSTEVSLLQKI